MANEDIVSALMVGTVELLKAGNPVIFRLEDLEAAGETPESWTEKLVAATKKADLTLTTTALAKRRMLLVFANNAQPSEERVHEMVAYLDIERKLREAKDKALAEPDTPEGEH